MRAPRKRRRARKNRAHSQTHYVAMATRIQKCFREFCARRYEPKCVNYDDTDFISMNAVGCIPRDLLFVCGDIGYDARDLFTWMLTKNADPISREKFTVPQRQACAQQLRSFVSASRKTQSGKRGFFSRYRVLLNSLKYYAKLAENN